MLVIFALFAAGSVQADVYMFRDEAGEVYFTNLAGQGRTRVHLPLKRELKKGKWPAAGSGGGYERAIAAAGERFAVDPDLLKAVIRAESNFDPRAVSSKGAQGLMQLMPGTAREMDVADPFDPAENIYGGARYLRGLLELLNGDMTLALAAYNAGPGSVSAWKGVPPFTETRLYVERVLRHYRELKVKNSM